MLCTFSVTGNDLFSGVLCTLSVTGNDLFSDVFCTLSVTGHDLFSGVFCTLSMTGNDLFSGVFCTLSMTGNDLFSGVFCTLSMTGNDLFSGVFCTLSVTGNNDRVAYIGHNVSLSCLIQRDGVDIYHNQNHLPENYTVTWQLTPVNSDHSRLLLTVLISPSSRPRIVQTADGIKYVNSLNDASIMIRDVEFQDAGVYTCSIHTVSQVKNATSDLFVICKSL